MGKGVGESLAIPLVDLCWLGEFRAIDIDDRSCELAVLAMRSNFAADDLVGGIRAGAMLLAEHARAPRVLHLNEPA